MARRDIGGDAFFGAGAFSDVSGIEEEGGLIDAGKSGSSE